MENTSEINAQHLFDLASKALERGVVFADKRTLESGVKVDLRRKPVDIVKLKDGLFAVITEPSNWADYFTYFRAMHPKKYASAKAMQDWFHINFLWTDEMALEVQTWHGGRLPKDADKAYAKFEKFKNHILAQMDKRKNKGEEWPRLQAVSLS